MNNKLISNYSLVILFSLFAQTLLAQSAQKDTPKGWHLLDRTDSGYWGISLDKAYTFLKSTKKLSLYFKFKKGKQYIQGSIKSSHNKS